MPRGARNGRWAPAVAAAVVAGCVIAAAAAGGARSLQALSPTQIEFRIRAARADELEARTAVERGNVLEAEHALDESLDWLEPALASIDRTPALAGIKALVKSAVAKDGNAIDRLANKADVRSGAIRSMIDQAVVAKDGALAKLAPRTTPPPPPPAPPPPPPPPPMPTVPDGLLAGLKSIDLQLNRAIVKAQNPHALLRQTIRASRIDDIYDELRSLGRSYLPFEESLFDADAKLEGALSSELPLLWHADLESAAGDFNRVTVALAKLPELRAAAADLATRTEQAAAMVAGGRSAVLIIAEVLKAKTRLVNALPLWDEVKQYLLYQAYEETLLSLEDAAAGIFPDLVARDLEAARRWKLRLETVLAGAPQSPPVTIDTQESYAHNVDIHRTHDCVDVSTTPPQAEIDGSVTGPPGTVQLPRFSLSGGNIQERININVAGTYTWTLNVYNAAGERTGTTTVVSVVGPPPPDGPSTGKTIEPPCEPPTS